MNTKKIWTLGLVVALAFASVQPAQAMGKTAKYMLGGFLLGGGIGAATGNDVLLSGVIGAAGGAAVRAATKDRLSPQEQAKRNRDAIDARTTPTTTSTGTATGSVNTGAATTGYAGDWSAPALGSTSNSSTTPTGTGSLTVVPSQAANDAADPYQAYASAR